MRRELAPNNASEPQQHPRVTERVRLDAIQFQELRDPVIVRTQQLRVHLRRHWSAEDFGETVPSEEVHGEGQAEYARDAYRPRAIQQLVYDQVADAVAPQTPRHGDRSALRQVFPHYLQRPPPDHRALTRTP